MRLESILYGTMALLFLSACSKLDQREPAPAAVNWQVIQDSPSTKASAYSTDNTFLAWAWYLPDGQNWSSNKASAQRFIGDEHGVTIGFVSSENAWKNVIWDGSAWADGASYYWPKAGALTFFAVSPSSLGTDVSCTIADGIKISNWDVGLNQDKDVMVADLATDRSSNTSSAGGWLNGVPTIFRHKLAMLVGFNFNTFKDYENGHDGTSGNKYTSSDITYLVKEVKISGYAQQGTFVVNAPSGESVGQWTVSDASPTYNYTWYANASGERIPYLTGGTAISANSLGGNTYLYLLPQQFTTEDAKLEIAYIKRTYNNDGSVSGDDDNTAVVSLKDLFSSTGSRLVLNRQITINITFNNDSNLIYWAPDQSKWGSGEFDVYV